MLQMTMRGACCFNNTLPPTSGTARCSDAAGHLFARSQAQPCRKRQHTKVAGTISLLGRCLKFVVLKNSLFMDLGVSVDEVDEICFGHSKLEVGIILEKV